MQDLNLLIKILCCPKCRASFEYDHKSLWCPNCSKHIEIDGRFLNFNDLTPKLTFHFSKYLKRKFEILGKKSTDIPINWRVKRVLKIIQSVGDKNDICLEIGGADGPMTPTLENLFQTVLTLDAGKYFLKRIEVKTKKTVCLCGDAQFIPIADSQMDIVVCSEVLEHVIAPTQLLLEIRRVLKKDGKLIITVPNEATINFIKRILQLVIFRWRKKTFLPSDSHINFYNVVSFKKLLFRMGFGIVREKRLRSPVIFNKGFKGFVFSLIKKLSPSYILCHVKIMDDPDIYWNLFIQRYENLDD